MVTGGPYVHDRVTYIMNPQEEIKRGVHNDEAIRNSIRQAITGHVHRDDEASKMGMWLFLFTELLLFGGMFLLYAGYSLCIPMDLRAAALEMN